MVDLLLHGGLYHMIDAGVSELSSARSPPPTAVCEMVSRGLMMKSLSSPAGTNAGTRAVENCGATLRHNKCPGGAKLERSVRTNRSITLVRLACPPYFTYSPPLWC
jgi:hypothetical protein